MYIQENLTTTPHEVPDCSWELPDALAEKFYRFGAFSKLVLNDDRSAIADIVEDTERREEHEKARAREEQERAEREAEQERARQQAALEKQGVAVMARSMFRSTAAAMPADDVIRCRALAEEWTPGIFEVGNVRTEGNIPYRCCQAHDSTGNPDWSPSKYPALWAPYHGTTPETALPWIAPTGAHDLYKQGECIVWTDGRTLRAVQDTNFSPDDLLAAWADA
ncbi:hypothetical protein D7X33_07450 [Butyricicoccus sp. 1XD8-22]|nr:hypothetical protein D7X33_07450 [Butyricicoccus sp. 1XD8-22]